MDNERSQKATQPHGERLAAWWARAVAPGRDRDRALPPVDRGDAQPLRGPGDQPGRLSVVSHVPVQWGRNSLADFTRRVNDGYQTVTNPRQWSLWVMPVRIIVWVLGWEAVALGLVVIAYSTDPAGSRSQWVTAAGLLVASSAHHVVTRADEERRFGQRAGGEHIEFDVLWEWPAAILLPTVPMLCLLVLIKIQRYGIARTSVTKHVFASAAVAISMLAAHEVALAMSGGRWISPATDNGQLVGLVVVAAIATYFAVQAVLVPGVRALSTPKPERTWASLFGTVAQNVEQLGALALAAMIALSMDWSTWTLALALPIAIAATVMVERLAATRAEAHTDARTGLLNRLGWEVIAGPAVELTKPDRPTGVLMVDVDYLKHPTTDSGTSART